MTWSDLDRSRSIPYLVVGQYKDICTLYMYLLITHANLNVTFMRICTYCGWAGFSATPVFDRLGYDYPPYLRNIIDAYGLSIVLNNISPWH